MSEYAILKKSKNHLANPHKKTNVQSTNARTSSFPVVQMIRKRVFHTKDDFDLKDIYYDKKDGKYYNDIMPDVKRNKEISQDVYASCRKLFEKYSSRTTILAENKTSDTFIQFDQALASNKTKADPVSVNAMTFTTGNQVNPVPKVIRLYAEGNMDHALSLDKSLDSQDKYDRFVALSQMDTSGTQGDDSMETLIKATEFDSKTQVRERYHHDGRVTDNLKAVHRTERTEASFGGNTGDMTHVPSGKQGRPMRKYDMIQTTFFWLPGETNNENFNNLKAFMINKKDKLKADGKIRIILTNRDPRYFQALSDSQKDNEKNGYAYVAEKLSTDTDLKTIYNIDKILLEKKAGGETPKTPRTYADTLQDLELNPDGEFQHTQTYGDIIVGSWGDLVIEGRLLRSSSESTE